MKIHWWNELNRIIYSRFIRLIIYTCIFLKTIERRAIKITHADLDLDLKEMSMRDII